MLKKTMTKPRTAAKRPARKILTLVQQNKAKRKRAPGMAAIVAAGPNRAAYDKVCNQLKEVKAGRRGWISLTAAAKDCGVSKTQLSQVARALGLEVEDSHGRHGMTAHRPATQKNPDFSLYRAAQSADSAYEAELRKVYGAAASEARYTAKGKASARLKALHAAKVKADAKWLAEMRRNPGLAAIEKKVATADAAVGKLNQALIDAGRGHERHSEIIVKKDALSAKYAAAVEKYHRLTIERDKARDAQDTARYRRMAAKQMKYGRRNPRPGDFEARKGETRMDIARHLKAKPKSERRATLKQLEGYIRTAKLNPRGPSTIQQIDGNTWETTNGNARMQLKFKPATGTWEVWTWSPAARTGGNRHPDWAAVHGYSTLKQIEAKYKSWRGISALLADHAGAKANPRGKASTVAGAKRLYKKFIGKAPHKFTRTPTAHPAAARAKGGKLPVAKLATLSYLKVRNPAIKGGMIRFKGAERPKLLSHASGRQYYFQGGNQKLAGIPAARATVNKNPPAYSRAGLKAADVRTMLNLGEVEEIGYFERKKVEDFRPVEYFHELGEENGKRPTLVYDAAHQQMHLVGGDYRTLWSGINN